MSMTRRDFEAIARVVRKYVDASEPCARWIGQDLAAELEYSNERFDRERFLTACGL